ncbi:glycosyltransferase family 15 protein [Flagelloscypha sp. PMI_526]|nr:glycosyltransferase family 15 protein [Flagelloscypha sp. PMI_526]
MNVAYRYIFLVVLVFLGLYFVFQATVSEEGVSWTPPNLGNISFHKPVLRPPHAGGQIINNPESQHDSAPSTSTPERVNAVIVILARNEDVKGVTSSMKQLEWSFNNKYGYPYVFLNEKEFSEDFKSRVSVLTNSKVEFGLIPRDHWYQPSWIDEERAKKAREDMKTKNVPYGDNLGYRNMCRFNSGFFYRHELLQKYKYYWRVEPDVTFFCDITYDPFRFMQDHKKVYGFTIALPEYIETVPTLWDSTKEFLQANPHLAPSDNGMSFLSDNGGESYNYCHFWSNFEIGDLDFWRGEAYSKYFDFLDHKGGFYYERWGDAPVHSIGVALFARKDQLHFFEDIGYRHEPIQHCPQGKSWKKGKCWCDPNKSIDLDSFAWGCIKRYHHLVQ